MYGGVSRGQSLIRIKSSMAPIIEYYVRCPHGISVEQCDLCKKDYTAIPKPLHGHMYTYEECLEYHTVHCRCDGCNVYRISNNDFRKAKGLEPIPHGLRL